MHVEPLREAHGRPRQWSRDDAAAATTALVVATRAGERRSCPRTNTTHPTGTEEDGPEREEASRSTRRRSGRPPLQLELFHPYEEEPGGSRPDRLAGVRPQERVQRHTAEQIVDSSPGLPTPDALVPLIVEHLVDVLQFFDALLPVAEQVFCKDHLE